MYCRGEHAIVICVTLRVTVNFAGKGLIVGRQEIKLDMKCGQERRSDTF